MCVWVRFCRSTCRSLATGFSRECASTRRSAHHRHHHHRRKRSDCIFFWKHLFVDTVLDLFMASKGILSAERLFVITDLASNFLPVCIVNSVFMASEIVGPGEDSVARLVGSRVNPSTLVRAGVMRFDARQWGGLSVSFTSVLRHLGGGRKPFCAAGNRASVNASVSPRLSRLRVWRAGGIVIVVVLLLSDRSLRNGIGPRICVRKANLCILLVAIASIKLRVEVHAHVALPSASGHAAKALLGLDAKTVVRLNIIIAVNRALIASTMSTSILRVRIILREKAAFDVFLLRLAIVDVGVLRGNSLRCLAARSKALLNLLGEDLGLPLSLLLPLGTSSAKSHR